MIREWDSGDRCETCRFFELLKFDFDDRLNFCNALNKECASNDAAVCSIFRQRMEDCRCCACA